MRVSIAFDLDPPEGSASQVVDHIVEAAFFIDIILSFFQEYRDPQNFEYIKEFQLIAKHYLK